MVAHTERIVLLDDSLFVSCGLGNGSAFRRRGPLADRFSTRPGYVVERSRGSHATDACFTHALVLNDLMRLRETLPDAFAVCDLDRAALLRRVSCSTISARREPVRIWPRTTTR
jgi:hypothetical protein